MGMTDIRSRASGDYDDARVSLASAPPSTLSNALATITDAGERAHILAEHAERLANQISGVAPAPDVGASKGRREADNLSDALNDRAMALRDPMSRIGAALERIERRFG